MVGIFVAAGEPVAAGLDRRVPLRADHHRIPLRGRRDHRGPPAARLLRAAAHRRAPTSTGWPTSSTHLGQANGWALAIGLGVLALLVVAGRDRPAHPGRAHRHGPLHRARRRPRPRGPRRPRAGHGQGGAPHLGLSGLSWSTLQSLAPLAAVVALVVVTQTAATTRAFADLGGYDVDAGRDFLAVGGGSVLAGLSGSFPVDASPPRTGAVAAAGGRTQAGPLGAAVVIIFLIPFAGIFKDVPLATLAAILIFVAGRLFNLRRPFGHRPLLPARVRAGPDHAAHGGADRRRAGHRGGRGAWPCSTGSAGVPSPSWPCSAGWRGRPAGPRSQADPDAAPADRCAGRPLRHSPLVRQRDPFPRADGRRRGPGARHDEDRRARRHRHDRRGLHRIAGARAGPRRLRTQRTSPSASPGRATTCARRCSEVACSTHRARSGSSRR